MIRKKMGKNHKSFFRHTVLRGFISPRLFVVQPFVSVPIYSCTAVAITFVDIFPESFSFLFIYKYFLFGENDFAEKCCCISFNVVFSI